MKFGSVPVAEALGAILAHSASLDGGSIKKGTVLNEAHLAQLAAAGLSTVVVARLEREDIPEDEAAMIIAKCLVGPGLRLGIASTGRVNLIAEEAGLVRIDRNAIADMNAVDEGVTLATLPDLMRTESDQLVATVKIIPYGVARSVVDGAAAALGSSAIRHLPFAGGRARLILTRTEGFKESLLKKGEATVRARVEALGYRLDDVHVVAHEPGAVAGALAGDADLTLILGGSATSDRHDVAPEGVVAAGGVIERFGMPVDPGNLLFLGSLRGHPVVGLPGCARSPALNGADWVLERLSAGVPVTGSAIAGMGFGGLLKEMPDRPHPRRSRERR